MTTAHPIGPDDATPRTPPLPPPSSWRPAVDIPDGSDRVLYPLLSDRLLAAIGDHAMCRTFAPAECLFEQGERHAPFFVVESGRVVFFDRNRDDGPGVYFAQVTGGMFIGDTAMFTGEPTVAECRAIERTRVLELSHDQLRELVAHHAEAGDLILRTLMARRAWLEGHGYGLLQLLGPSSCAHTVRIREFLSRNQVPFAWRDTESDGATAAVLERLGVHAADTPVILAAGEVRRNPRIEDIASCLGLRPELADEPYDLAVVGGGPGGLAAAVYGASEGLRTVLLDATAPGGQAATSSKIENYLGFTTGISGAELARQAVLQARKFGATLSTPTQVRAIECDGAVKTLRLDDGRSLRAHVVVLATGAEYRRLEAEGCDGFEGNGVFYAAGHLEAQQVRGRRVLVVGGGNSAGQAAVFLSQHCAHVSLVIRRKDLAATMSHYLIARIERTPGIEVVASTEVQRLGSAGGRLATATLATADGDTVHERTVECAAVFCMIGAEPRTDWLDGCCALDEKGFVLTGADARRSAAFAAQWQAEREPFLLETSRPGVLAVGDCRAGSVKRVATAVGEGAMAVKFVHELLALASAR